MKKEIKMKNPFLISIVLERFALMLFFILSLMFGRAQEVHWTTDLLNVGEAEAKFGTVSNDPLNLYTNGTKKLVLDTNGDLILTRMAGFEGKRLVVVDENGAFKPVYGTIYESYPCVTNAMPWYEGGNNVVGSYKNIIGPCNNVPFILQANNTPAVYITTLGLVGIGPGNDNPDTQLDISDGSGEHLKFLGDAGGSIIASSEMNLRFGLNNVFTIIQGGTSILNINSTGKVGIGVSSSTVAATTKLTVDAGSGDGILSRTSSGTAKALSVYNTTSSKQNFAVYGDGRTCIGTQSGQFNTAMFNINVQGSSGTPVDVIDVFDQYSGTAGMVNFRVKSDGQVWCRELTVEYPTATFPDFVFNESYKLETLQEREKYLKKNLRLPYLLSAKEVEGNGAPVGNLMKGILQNTEELTLYIIEINKKIEKLEKENEELKKQFMNLNSLK